ncbi:MHYT domain-containing protein [Microvirga sp. VF16]|uniref:MHYT domain-containing protein n=1 Tax=Microvirga sp. VF16 TaxID=2807101 RepID=UPI001FEF747D|nr:MHYT domain-containing protein [Microvirga sp. VF16]
MLTVYDCIIATHDLRLVALAALVCALASLTGVNLLHHVRRSDRNSRIAWLGIAAASTGVGIWATHFIAMLAFSPSLPTAYNVSLTIISLVAAVMLTGIGLGIALLRGLVAGPLIGGAIVGGGIAVMHYTGMAAFEVAGTIAWNWALVTTSILLGAVIGAGALFVALSSFSLPSKVVGALLLTLAICSHHFTAMGAVAITPDPSIALSPSSLRTE